MEWIVLLRIPPIGELITERRKKKGLSQFQLGKLIGVTDKAVSKWENNEAMPRLEHYVKLADILEFSLEDVIQAGTSQYIDDGDRD